MGGTWNVNLTLSGITGDKTSHHLIQARGQSSSPEVSNLALAGGHIEPRVNMHTLQELSPLISDL